MVLTDWLRHILIMKQTMRTERRLVFFSSRIRETAFNLRRRGNVFKAISDPTRRKILKLLNDKDLSAGEIAEHFDISKPALTKHLNILREAELVSSEKQGNFVIYSINVTVLQQALSGFMSIFEKKE